jgi:hypothetical protein
MAGSARDVAEVPRADIDTKRASQAAIDSSDLPAFACSYRVGGNRVLSGPAREFLCAQIGAPQQTVDTCDKRYDRR